MATILIVDDNKESRDYLHTLLQHYGHHVLDASDGSMGLQVAQKTHVDLIITDILMPIMNGYELVKNLKLDEKLSNIPVIFYTAAYRALDASTIALNSNVNFVLTKPSDIKTTLATINNALKVNQEPIPPKISPAASQDSKHLLGERLSEYLKLKKDLQNISDGIKLIKTFCEGARKIEMVTKCVLGIKYRNKNTYSLYISTNDNKFIEKKIPAIQPHDNFLNRLLERKFPIKINRLMEQPQLLMPEDHVGQSILGVPVSTETQDFGFIYFSDKMHDLEFDDMDMEIAVSLAQDIAAILKSMGNIYEDTI